MIFISREELDRKEVQLKQHRLVAGGETQQDNGAVAATSAALGAGRIAQLEAQLRLTKVRVVHRV